MSSISRLSLSKASDTNAQVAGFDETIGNSGSNGVDWHDGAMSSVTSHAVAHKTVVCGTQPGSDWISWNQSFAPHRVCRVASNSNGTVIAASVDNGTVSILRGVDGTILATRRIALEGIRVPAEVSFLSGNQDGNNNNDVLVIEPPEGDIILVSNIQGSRLNSDDKGVVSDAARSMVIHALKFQDTDVRAIRGCYIDTSNNDNADMIRFALVDGDGKLAIHDYDLQKKELVQKEIPSLPPSVEIDFHVGLRVQQVRSKTFLVACLSVGGNDTMIGWFNLNTLTIACQYRVSPQVLGNNTTTQRTRLLALEPLVSFDETKSLAVVVTIKPPGDSKMVTKILQGAVGEDNGGIGRFHELYNIPVPSSVKSLAIAPLVNEGPYSFRCITSHSGDKYECHDFQTDNGSAIGSVRLLLVANQFDEAYSVVDQFGKESLVADAFADFHPSEIALCQLQLLLSKGRLSDEISVHHSRESLQKLAAGALSGNKNGQKALLKAVECVLEWPDKTSIQNNPPTIGEVVTGLAGILKILASTKDLSSDFQKLKTESEEKLCAMKYLESVISENIPLNSEFSSIRSVQDLFTGLIKHNYFLAAEQMRKSHLKPKLTTEVMVSAILNIPATVNPRYYANLFKEIIFPSLTINHELLPPLLAWSCKTADKFDDDGNKNGLDDAIFLLEMFERGTKDLRVKIHSSFASHTPFVENLGHKKRRISPRNDSSNMVSTLDSSFFSVASSQSSQDDKQVKDFPISDDIERPNPTILELGRMKGGAQKSRSRKIASLEAMDESEECVETKLIAARCLKHARALGLDHSLVSLRTFLSYGGARFIAKELVRLYSSRAKSHEERLQKFSEFLRNFCEDSAVVFDEALMMYAKELCRGKNTSKKAIEESASLARCCVTTTIRCQVVLVTLRAALFCRHSPIWLSELSQEAIEWSAGDSLLRSELEEASRLLLIDGIVGRYCGDGAKELFHVDNPRHAIRLVEFMSCQIMHERVLSDTLDLCEAFAHLSKEDACSRIIQNAILQGNDQASASLLESLYYHNVELAKASFSRVITFCIDIIEEGSIEVSTCDTNATAQREQVIFATSCAYCLANTALSHVHSNLSGHAGFSSSFYDEERLEELVEDLFHLKILQNDHNVFLSLTALHNPKCLVDRASDFLKELVVSYTEGKSEGSRAIVTRTKRVCSLLAGSSRMDDVHLWFAAVGNSACSLAKSTSGMECLNFLTDLGVLDSVNNDLSARSCLAVALSFCMKASKESNSHEIKQCMKYVIMAASLLKDSTVSRCPFELLGVAVTIGELCDIICQILVRSDEGVGEEMDSFRKKLQSSKNDSSDDTNMAEAARDSLLLHRPCLHPSWYVGDGLLLPPSETLIRGLEFCKLSLRKSAFGDATRDLYSFVEGRGAYALALRVLCFSSMTQMSQTASLDNFADFEATLEVQNHTITALAERSLGGSGNGILSGVVDSQLAASFLLCLPLKLAFKVYKSSLPTAMSTRDFKRLRKLANVGQAAGSGDLLPSNVSVLRDWKKQEKFIVQCQQLALRAKWWGTLQRFNVQFDLCRFDEGRLTSANHGEEEKGTPLKYVNSLIPLLIANMAGTNVETGEILQTATNFASAFGLSSEIPIQHYLEHLLSPPKAKETNGSETKYDLKIQDTDLKLSNLESLVKSLVRRLESPTHRINVIRKCLIRLEKSNDCKDYERLAVISSIYHMELASFIQAMNKERVDPKPYLHELELVDRRVDALAILSSYFQGDKKGERPLFSLFFSPFPDSLDTELTKETVRVQSRILGSESKKQEETFFDPLSPLDTVLGSSCNSAVTSALAPLCLPLGVPRGYIHARSLIARFKKSKLENVALPSFETDVLPVLDRLKLPADIADLAEWCSLQYAFDNEDKLRTLDHSMNSAIQASSEVEGYARQTSQKNRKKMNELESIALERVKRISVAKDLLVDRLAISAILSSVGMTSEKFCAISNIVDELMKRLDEQVWNKDEFIPETFVEIFLTESSLLAAEASLCHQQALSIGNFKKLCVLVHEACKSVAERYSHVQIGDIAKKLVRRWLFHGDQLSSDEKANDILDSSSKEGRVYHDAISRLLPDIEEEDTMNFVMDLASLSQEENIWSSDIGSSQHTKQTEKKYTSEEEPSSLKSPGCANESSERKSRRASLRIAFAMAYADGYYGETASGQGGKENTTSAGNSQTQKENQKQKSRGGLLAKIGNRESRKQHDNVIEHSKELLRIVFAKPGSSNLGSIDGQKTITFAMRHRALRASSVLCPQETLEEVIVEEGFLKASKTSSLKKTSFAAYVAKEIEELGLPLPHSDLSQLSTIDFSSFARTLWRHHRDSKASKGRLLLLIIQMYLREDISDYEFFLSIVTKIQADNLPRTLLLTLEATKRYLERMEDKAVETFFKHAGNKIALAIKGLSEKIHTEFLNVMASADPSSHQIINALETFERFAALVRGFCHGSEGQKNLKQFVESQLQIVSSLSSKNDRDRMLTMIDGMIKLCEDTETRKGIAEKISKYNDGNASAYYVHLLENQERDSTDEMFISLAKLEGSLF